ncbi:zinc ribbon domain-containing protein [Thermincola potens]|uniref:C4-type zinc ribbon domain-containing protein n=1 Tax=Thermincola potens (strain JR) TaxID=635013 RepID=D5XA06_THEPJ|nr:C4-type zinc ribbon domain-containing protein [Thermincola potens]ADG83139.1 protein of unknown function DUF164 [Thermincola potens JR]
MKEYLKLLWDLQNLESQLNELGRPLKSGTAKLKQLKTELEEFKQIYEQKKNKFEQIKKKNRAREHEVESLKEKLAATNFLLYSDKVSSPKELKQAQHKVEQIEKQIAALEDEIIDNLEKMEGIENELSSVKQEIEAGIKEFKILCTAFQREKDSREAEVSRISDDIEKLKESIGPEILRWFTEMREKFPDKKPVALIQHDTCTGCNMVLSIETVKRLKNQENSENIFCENCGRILFTL